ncbi:MAG: 16S rRNA (guanine(527)-N(7))-methyltransferase RsmG [Clostridia bacterium]
MKQLLYDNIPNLTEQAADKLCRYYELLVDWNSRINLTAITEPLDVVQKHFADSLLPCSLIPNGASLIDVGTGAGFPGLPLAIVRQDIRLTLLDSLNKRVVFLQEACRELDIPAICIHARAEDAGRNPSLRGKFDVATSRAVAGVSALCEYTLPLLKVGGLSIMYKGPQAQDELKGAHNALKTLGAVASISAFDAPWGERRVISVTKRGETPNAYPRKAGTAQKMPL